MKLDAMDKEMTPSHPCGGVGSSRVGLETGQDAPAQTIVATVNKSGGITTRKMAAVVG